MIVSCGFFLVFSILGLELLRFFCLSPRAIEDMFMSGGTKTRRHKGCVELAAASDDWNVSHAHVTIDQVSLIALL